MKTTLTAIAAILYALILWLFAPQTVWNSEVKKAKSKRNKPATDTSEKPLETPQKPEIVEDTQTTETLLETTETPLETAPETKPQQWRVKELRKEAQSRKIQWKDNNGKPLKKSELMALLEIA